jgi:hypothetical protein
MNLSHLSDLSILRRVLGRVTVRWRLTLLYSLLFLFCAAVLLAITYNLFANYAFNPPKPGTGPGGAPLNKTSARIATAMSFQRQLGLHRLQLYSALALAIMAVVSVALGWMMAGRVLAPLRTITATTDRISDSNLHERLALSGPRDELRQLADTIDRLLARLQAAFDAQRLFVANASHELRTPLAMMRTTLDVALTAPEGVPPELMSLEKDLREDLDHAGQLLESFLALARAQHGELGQPDQVVLEGIIKIALDTRGNTIDSKRLALSTSLAAARVTGSETLLTRLVENVIENAIRYTPAGGGVSVVLDVDDTQAELIVENDGPILHADRVAELAQPFRRLGRDRTYTPGGHGLGLAIVAAIASAHSGNLMLATRPQGGLRVRITLPNAITVESAGVVA